jgi:hypothetical protein
MRVTARQRYVLLGLLSFLCLIHGVGAVSQETTPTTTICSISQSPEQFDNKIVTVRARVQADGQHGSQIYDEACGSFGIGLFVVQDAKGKHELDSALSWCHRGTKGKLIVGTFTGVFHFKNGNQANRSIDVQRIDELVLKSTKTTSATFPVPCPDAPSTDTLLHESGHLDPPKQQ